MELLLKAEPLPIDSVLLETVNGDGRCAPICACADFDAAETALQEWLGRQSGPKARGIAPVRVKVSFPRRLVFSYDFHADEFGLMEEPVPAGYAPGQTATAVTLRERLGRALRESLEGTAVTVEDFAAQRVARIVLAYGNPTPMGN